MQFNYYFLKHLVEELKPRLIGKKSVATFTQNKNELILCFEDQESFTIKANLENSISLLSFPKEFARARKNSVNLFESLENLEVCDLKLYLNERAFSIQYENEFQLLFKLHGRHSNIILYQKEMQKVLFKNNIEKDKSIELNTIDRPIDQSKEALLASSFDLGQIYPTFDKHCKAYLKKHQFYDSSDQIIKINILNDLLLQLNDKTTYLTEIDGIPKLLLLLPDQGAQTMTDPIEACNQLARQFFTNYHLANTKSQLVGHIQKEIKKCQAYIKQSSAKLDEIEHRRGHEEIANILMANLHVSVRPNQKSIELLDFYNDQQTTIKIKPNLSLQKNAEILYRKSKNQNKEIEILRNNIESKRAHLQRLKEKKETIENAENTKALKTFESNSTKKGTDSSSTLPFLEFKIDGYDVLIGKNAKNNDLLTQKHARKDDLWLHARDVSGSHVVIRNPNGAKIPVGVIEKVARLAAWYSKRKTDSLCPVIYTPKKYVRKAKGSLPGQVTLSQEQVILVKPERPGNA